jgi:hypothetical protein
LHDIIAFSKREWMNRLLLAFLTIITWSFNVYCVPIETPDFEESNEFIIKSPPNWGYRTFRGKNGLIGALWPYGTSFNSTDTAIFVFVQNDEEKLPAKPDNIQLFTEKCPKMNFHFWNGNDNDETASIAEQYFIGRCGRTMILFKEVIGKYTLVIVLVSSRYVTKRQLKDAKNVVAAYVEEIKKYIKIKSEDDSEDNSENEDDDENSSKSKKKKGNKKGGGKEGEEEETK